VIVIVAIGAVGGSYAYAGGAVASLQTTCSTTSTSVNWVGLTISILTSNFTPSTVLGEFQLEFGIHNPSSLSVNSNWIMQINFGSALMKDSEAFAVPAGSTQLVLFHLPVTVTTAIQILSARIQSGIYHTATLTTVSLTRDDSALGFHFTNQYSTQTTLAPISNSTPNSTSTLPSC